MPRYVICPRCELNFIDADAQEYCDVCQKELQGAKTFADDLEEEEERNETELCPICGENYMRPGEKMCDECKKKNDYEEEETEDMDKDDAWRSYLDDDDIDDLGISLPEEDLDEEEEEEEEEEESYAEEDDFEVVTADDYDPDEDDEDDEDDDSFDDDEAPTPRSGKKKSRRDDDF